MDTTHGGPTPSSSADLTVRGLFETHLTVADLSRSVAFYRDVIGLPLALELPEREAAFHWIGGPGQAMLGLWSVGSAPVGLRLHIAFAATLDDVLAAPSRLAARGVQPLSFFGEPTAEPSVIGWMPAAAVYCRDPDGHMLEYLAMLDGPPRPELGIVSWSDYEHGPAGPAVPVHVEPHHGPRSRLRPLFELAEDSAEQLDAYIEDGRVFVAVAGDDAIVGQLQVTGTAEDGELEVKNMAVLASHRRRGIGRQLIQAAATLARADGCVSVRVATAAADVDNLAFYQRMGFRMRGIDRDAFTPATGYEPGLLIHGIELRDRVWLDMALTTDG